MIEGCLSELGVVVGSVHHGSTHAQARLFRWHSQRKTYRQMGEQWSATARGSGVTRPIVQRAASADGIPHMQVTNLPAIQRMLSCS